VKISNLQTKLQLIFFIFYYDITAGYLLRLHEVVFRAAIFFLLLFVQILLISKNKWLSNYFWENLTKIKKMIHYIKQNFPKILCFLIKFHTKT